MNSEFKAKVKDINESYIKFDKLETLQVNLGDICNQTCSHCHITAGPEGEKFMPVEVMDDIVSVLKKNPGLTLDITGGAPEMNPNFKYLVESSIPYASKIMVRTNLTIMQEEGYEYLPDWYKQHGIVLIASLPCYIEENVDNQRGSGVYKKSIEALKMLNRKGYGKTLELNIVYNPGSANLPGNQIQLEQHYKERLYNQFGILFNYLFTITNAPIGRFEKYLIDSDQHNKYMQLLKDSFNPGTVGSIMCRVLINVDWTGTIYNCDFNKVKEMPIRNSDGNPLTIKELDIAIKNGYQIEMADHCYVCTAGAGSCCTGALQAG